MAEASFSLCQQELIMEVQQATIKAKRASEARDAELSKDDEKKRAEMELERLRAQDVVKSIVSREIHRSTQLPSCDSHHHSLAKWRMIGFILLIYIGKRYQVSSLPHPETIFWVSSAGVVGNSRPSSQNGACADRGGVV
jgi:hypothetical protein